MKNTLCALCFGLCLFALCPSALAQHHPSGEHAEPAAVHEGFHNPGPINMFDIRPPERVEHSGPGGRSEHRPGPPPFIGPIINFAVLLLLGYIAMSRSINPALAARKAAAETEIAEARRMKSEAEAMHSEYSLRLAQIDREAATIVAEFTRAGEAERDRIIAEASARADRARAEARASIEQEIMNLRDELRREVAGAAASAAADAVRKSINASDQQRMVGDYLAALDAAGAALTPAAGAGARS